MICNNSSAAAGGSIKDLTIDPPEFSHSGNWNDSRSAYIHTFSGLTKDKLGKGVIVAVVVGYAETYGGYVKVYISPNGTAEVDSSGSDVNVASPYNPSVGTLAISVAASYSGSANYFILRRD